MRRRLATLGAAALMALPVAAQSPQSITWGTEFEGQPARPHIVVPPDYPKEAAAQKRTATVDVVGHISAEGFMERPAFRSSSDDPAFEREVASVIGLWVFRAPVDSLTCKPKGGEAQLRVWFEIGEKGPKVSISMQALDVRVQKAAKERGEMRGVPAIVHKEVPVFPRSAIRRGIQGGVLIALARVDPEGSVTEVLFQDMRADKELVRESERALRLWKFDVKGHSFEGRSHLCAEIPIEFRLTH